MAAGVLSRGGVWDYFAQRAEYRRMSLKLQEARRRFSGKQVLVARAEKEDEFIEAAEEDIEIAAHLGGRWGLPHGSAAAIRTPTAPMPTSCGMP